MSLFTGFCVAVIFVENQVCLAIVMSLPVGLVFKTRWRFYFFWFFIDFELSLIALILVGLRVLSIMFIKRLLCAAAIMLTEADASPVSQLLHSEPIQNANEFVAQRPKIDLL
jgi:hypothetical protein